MKIGITGHTKGIGKALYDTLIYKGHTVYGFSRQNSYDISDQEDRNAIIHKVKDCDVFINNAWLDFYQVDLFNDIFEQWKTDKTKTIININSRSKYGISGNPSYSATKKELAKVAYKGMFDMDKKCRIINVNPGYVKTEMTKDKHDTIPMLSATEVTDMILWTLDQPQHIEIGEISMWLTSLDHDK